MLHKKAYQEFMTLLNQWQESCVVAESNGELRAEITREFPKLQQCFEQQITTLTDDELDLKLVSLWRSIHTEVQREFRLLSIDTLFLSSARQITTKKKRLKTIGDRNSKLIAYCQKILELLSK